MPKRDPMRAWAIYVLTALTFCGLIVWKAFGMSPAHADLWWWLLLLWGTMLLGWVHQPLIKQLFPGIEDPRIKTEPARHLTDYEVMVGYMAVTAAIVALASFLVAPLLLNQGYGALFEIKSWHFWWASAATGVLNVGIFYFFNKGMRYGDQSLASAAWGLNSVVLLPSSFIFFGLLGGGVITNPQVSAAGFLGILCVSGAIAFNALTQKTTTFSQPPTGDWFAHHPILSAYLGIGVIAPIAVNFDKIAIDAGNPFLAGVVTFGIVSLIAFLWICAVSGWKRIRYIFRTYSREYLIQGIVHGALCVVFNIVLLGHNINYYGALKRTSVVFGVLYGIWVLREGGTFKNKAARLFASITILIGVILIITKG